MKYICKPKHSIVIAKGVIGPPVDPENPKPNEIITVANFKNGQKGLTAILQHNNCPIMPFEPKKPGNVKNKDSQEPEKENEKQKGAVKK